MEEQLLQLINSLGAENERIPIMTEIGEFGLTLTFDNDRVYQFAKSQVNDMGWMNYINFTGNGLQLAEWLLSNTGVIQNNKEMLGEYAQYGFGYTFIIDYMYVEIGAMTIGMIERTVVVFISEILGMSEMLVGFAGSQNQNMNILIKTTLRCMGLNSEIVPALFEDFNYM